MSETLKVKEKYEDYLTSIAGVTGVAVNGSIVIYVEKLTPRLASFLPRELDGIPVKIKETGPIKLLSLLEKPIPVASAVYSNRTNRVRPVPGGVSCGHPEVTAGTLTSMAIDKKDRKVVGLSNNHVIALDWGTLHVGKTGDSTLQPGPYDGGKEPDDVIGNLKRWYEVKTDEPNLIDGAVFDSDELADTIQDVGKPSESVEPYIGMKVVGSGRTSGVVYSTITGVNATLKVEGWGVCTFKNQVIFEPAFMNPGDSGMWIGELDTYRTVSIGFAGSPLMSVGCTASNFEKLLDVEIIPPTKPISLWTIGGLIGAMATTGVLIYNA